ncbi:MAG: hypothetical protein ACREK6_07600 [Candidatus Rokuibacteriota bacterium]
MGSRLLALMLGVSLVGNAVQGVVVWTDTALIEQVGLDMDRLTASIRPLHARHERAVRVADELSDQLKQCRLTHIRQALGIER